MNNVGKGLNILSLFDGVSIGRLALEQAGFNVENYFSSEIDRHAIQVTKSNWPETIHVGDVTKLDASVFPKIDIMFAGFPCQSISNLGKGEGLEGKSGLFWEFVRLKDELKPTYWLVENVRGLKKAIDEITSVLGVEPIRINSSLMTAQKRDRLYWTNIPNITQPQDLGITLKDILEPGTPELSVLTPGRARWVCSEKGQQCFDKRYAVLDPIKANCLTARSDGSWNSNYVTRGEQITRLTPIEYERLQGMPDQYTATIKTTERYKSIGNSWSVPIIAHILSFIPQNMLTQEEESLNMGLHQSEHKEYEMTTQIWTSQDRKFATNSVCRKDAISFVQILNQCSEEVATHYVGSLVLECQQEAVKLGKVSHKVFLVRDDINEVDVYIDTCYYMVEN